MQSNENIEICSACGGICCKSSGGLVYPEDFGNIKVDTLIDAFKTGLYAVDYFDDRNNGLGSGYYIRTRIVSAQKVFDPNGLGQCVILSESGCELSYNQRPKGCRELIPNPPNCYFPNNTINLKTCAEAWKPFEELIEEAFRIVDEG